MKLTEKGRLHFNSGQLVVLNRTRRRAHTISGRNEPDWRVCLGSRVIKRPPFYIVARREKGTEAPKESKFMLLVLVLVYSEYYFLF